MGENMRKNLAAATVAAASVLGLGAGFAFGSPALVGAQTDTTTATTAAATGTATTTPTGRAGAAAAGAAAAPADPARVDYMKQALDKLVKDGTITQAQADAVAKAITDARPARGAHGPGDGSGKIGNGKGGFGGFDLAGGMGVVDAAAKALNITSEELIKQVMGGTTVAKIAESKGVALNTVVSAVVTEISTKIDAAVTAGKLTQAEADAKKATLTKTVTDFANGTMPTGMPGFGMPGARDGHGGHGGHAPGAAAPTEPAPAPTTTVPAKS